MRLFFGPASCSLAPHIILQELGTAFDIERVDLKTKQAAKSGDFLKINPKGYVPCLMLDNGETLTEGVAILQYLGDRAPEKNLVPANGTMERCRLQEALNFIATEIHKGFSPLWNKDAPEVVKQMAQERLFARLNYLNTEMANQDYVLGASFTVADAYLFTILNWTNFLKIDLARWTNLHRFYERIKARPSVEAAMKSEGILK